MLRRRDFCIWIDKVSGKLARRAEWDNLLASLREGDELAITRLSRMARSVKHLIEIATLLAERGLEAARARGRTGGRKPKLTQRQVAAARQMYDDKGQDGKRKHTVAQITETFGVSRKTIYRHLD